MSTNLLTSSIAIKLLGSLALISLAAALIFLLMAHYKARE
jgi:hypothetical protein